MVIDESLVEQLARCIHERYVAEQCPPSSSRGARHTIVDWSELDEDTKDANRAQARDIEEKLDRIGYAIGQPVYGTSEFTFSEAELDVLARAEHTRWTQERLAAGWTYAVVRDDEAKHHPSLVAWDFLSEAEKDKDRAAVRSIPVVLAAAGLQIVRR